MKILGISLSEFHDKAGFQLVQSVPEVTVLTKQQFNLCSDLMLPRQQLCGMLLALQFKEDYFLVVKPLLSKNKDWDKTYKREKYIYSISILVARTDYLDKVKQPLYKEIVSKLAQFFMVIEETHHIIYSHDSYMPYIRTKLTDIYTDINQKGSCNLTYQCHYYTFININRPPHIQKRFRINQSSVPVTLLAERQIDEIQSPFGRKLLCYAYKGTFTFKKICKLHPDRKQGDIVLFYRKAVEKGLVFMLDMVNLTNVYALNQNISRYMPGSQQSRQQLAEIAKVVNTSEGELDPNELLFLYLQFRRVANLAKIIQTNKAVVSKIDIVKFIRMGQIYGFLVRIHEKIAYSQIPSPLIMLDPLRRILTQRQKVKISISQRFLQEQSEKMSDMVKTMLNSNTTVDEMTVNLDIDEQRLLYLLSSQNRYVLQINDQ